MPDTTGAFPTRRSVCLKPGEGLSDSRLNATICRILKGWVLSSFSDPEGQRQVIGFLLPGDVRWVTQNDEAAELTALTGAEIQLIPLAVLLREQAEGGQSEVLLELYDSAQRPLLDQVRLLSGRSGRMKILRLISYLARRAVAAALAERGNLVLPLTRPVVADALGMTERHVSRVLKDLEAEGVIRLQRGYILVEPATLPV